MTRDQKVPVSNHVRVALSWAHTSCAASSLVYHRFGGVRNCLWLHVPIVQNVEKRWDCLPAPGFCLSPICQ